MSGIAFVLLGIAIVFIGYVAVTTHPTQVSNPTVGVIIGLSTSVLGVAATLLRRWAVVLLASVALAFSFFVSWGVIRGISFPWSVLLSAFYIAIASTPAFSTYFAWRELR